MFHWFNCSDKPVECKLSWCTVQGSMMNYIFMTKPDDYLSLLGDYFTEIYSLMFVAVSKLQTIAILARSSREMSQTVSIDWKHILSGVCVSVRPSNFLYAKNTQNYREYWVTRATIYLNEAATGHWSPATRDLRHSWAPARHRTATTWTAPVEGGCVRVCVRASVRAWCVCNIRY